MHITFLRRAVNVKQLYQDFPLLYQEKQETFSKFGSLTTGKIFETLSILIFEKITKKIRK